jgi:hypothetical protein
MGSAITTGGFNTCVGRSAGSALLGGSDNTFIGNTAGSTTTTGTQNICIGSNSTMSAAGISNELSIGSAFGGQYVATNGGAATYFPTATAGAVVLASALGFIRINLNGTFVKIPVYGN